MEWYFLSAGIENDVQYYYIVNNANGKYLRCDAKNNVYLDTYSDANDNKFKFKIVESPTTGTYNIYPHGLNILINKNTDNANNGVINTVDYNANNSNSGNTRWKFVSKSALDDQAVPFTVSDGSSRTHYKLRSSGDEFYVKAPAAANANATMVAAASADEDTYWYLEQAAAATDADWLTYYYIRNAKTGDYLYYTKGNSSDNNAAFKTTAIEPGASEAPEAPEAERYQFTWARSTTKDYYFMVPKMLRDQNYNDISTMNRNNTTLRVQKVRPTGTSAWTFVSASFCLDPVITQAANREVTITCPTPGVTIYYTTDGSNPVVPAAGNDPVAPTMLYSAAFTPESSVNQIKAIAVNINDNNAESAIVTLTLPKFTYHIVNRSGTIAASSSPIQQAAGISLSFASIPEGLRSPYISNEALTFYKIEGDFNVNKLNNENKITVTPNESANIYVTYTTDKLGEKFLHLQMARPMNLKYENPSSTWKYLWDNNGTVDYDESSEPSITTNNHLWYIGGSDVPDPYDVLVKNSTKTTNLVYTSSPSPSFSFDAGASSCVIVDTTKVDADHQDITLKNFTTGESFTIRVNTVEIPTSYYLIDKSGKQIFGPKVSTSAMMEIPSEWSSPLATYHYWRSTSFNESSGIYTLKDDQVELTGLAELSAGEHIYITYDVKDDIDLDGRNLLNDPEKVEGTTYMLEFQTPNTDDYKFYQEDGKDGVMTEKRRAVYPYSNGDATLYVYGNERWEEQLASGASTRTRWLWYLEPSTSKLDPYHVRISSYQTQTNYKVSDTDTRNFHSYLRTYQPEGYGAVVTGVTNNNPLAHGGSEGDAAVTALPKGTEYMLLGSSLSSMKLVTCDKISLDINRDGDTTDEGEGIERRTVNSFEQYWKNNPTVQGKLTTKVTTVGRDVVLNPTQKSEVEALGWHVYKAWANSAPWVHNHDEATTGGAPTTSKKFLEEEHVFQTIGMGDGSFRLVPTEIKPMLILLDQHGWEIVRLPLPSGPTDPKRKEIYANIHKYSSPMVARYHFWKTGSKAPGYHKYKVSDYATVSDVDLTEYTADELGRADITDPLTPPNLPNYATQALVSGKERDWYVTYDVKPEYANLYAGAATETATSASPFLIKQGDNYAQNSGDALTSTTLDTSAESIPTSYQWYLKPNFNIDREMGYQYKGETGAEDDADTKENTEAAYFAAGKNGFDPYNVQIQSVSNTNRYFTANTTGSAVAASWTGTSSAITLENMGTAQSVTGLDQVQMSITNATFMVIDDGAGNMRLMPRFDHTKVMQSFTTLAAPAAANTAAQIVEFTTVPMLVHNSSEIAAMGGAYILADDFTASGSIGTAANPFKGTIEGRLDKSFNVTAPFVAYAEDAVIKNVIIDNAYITSGNADGDAGAVVATAKGNTRVYNCGVNSGSVSGSRHVGSIVGHIEGYSRVINCYSYADVSGGEWAAGIVGYNDYLSTQTNLRTMVMNCMFYGNVTSGSKISPVYGGYIIDNAGSTGLNNFNYFSAEDFTANVTAYNCALGAEKRFLTRFEFYRQILNSNRELAAWYATGTTANARNVMAKWVLETADRTIADPKPYPVLKQQAQYPSIINYDAVHAPTSGDRNTGKQLGTLSVTISGVGSNAPSGASIKEGKSSLTLTRTDKDYDHFNFNYDKVQLPYYNDVGTGNYTKNRVVTGWKITSITGGTAGSYTTGADATTDADGNITSAPYNFADRNCTNKDLYTVSGRVFNQGAYWDVPKGVTGITIEPYWAEAVYLADSHADVVYSTTMTNHYNVPNVGGGEIYKNGSKYNIAGDSQEVYTSMDEARKKITTGKTVYDCAIVLVGNAHNIGVPSAEENRAYTIMSADFDHDNEPDYSYILRFNGRTECHPVRTDFVNIPGLGMAQKSTGGTGSYNFGILIPKGWFESTNTSLFRFTQFEYEHSSHPADAPLILQGGVMEQWVSNNQKGTSNKIPYIHVGGNVWFKEFHTGCHQDKQIATKHSPISVTGGDYDEFYLTGLYRGDITNKDDNAECYINGGRFGTVCGAAMEGIGNANGGNNTGNIVWQIQNADIHEFYAGGLNAAKPVTGNLSTTITDSYVDIFCGGPKFGDMSDNKAVHTKATGCTFGTYFGAGYGGNSYSRYAPNNQNNVTNINWNNWLNGQYKQDYNATYGGVSTQFNYQFLPMSDNATNVARILIDFVKFSLATTRNVTSNLTGCTVTGNFYGGGSLGKVDGNVTSTLTDCNVKGSAFGAGFSASLPTVEVDSLGFRTEPFYNENTGTYRTGIKGVTTTYNWEHRDVIGEGIDKTNHILYTTEDLNTLGTVTGKATLNITGNTLVEGFVFDASGNPTTQTGGVFGGGDASAALGDTEVNISASGQKAGSTYNTYNVFGGGNVASVGGSTEVNVNNGTVQNGVYGGCNAQGTIGGNTTVTLTGGTVGTAWGSPAPTTIPDVVFGGGLGEPTLVNGNVTVNVGTKSTDATPVYSGNASIYGNVYGGSALGNTNAMKPADALVFDATKKTDVNLYAGTINGNVFGGGLGRKAAAADPEHGIEAVTAVESFVGGDVNVTLDGAKLVQTFTGEGENRMPLTAQIFGANNLNGTPKGHVKVHVMRTIDSDKSSAEALAKTRTQRNTYDVAAVYGGGNQADYVPTNATLDPNVDGNKTLIEKAFAEVIIDGCGATSIEYVYGGGNAAAVPATEVTINGSYIINQVFGGGNGKSTDTFTNPGANVGIYNNGTTNYGTGITFTKLVGGKINEVYGGSNTLGNVRGGTTLKRETPGEGACDLEVGEIYGAGQVAPMDGDVNIILECMPDAFVEAVYGGAKNAVVNGNVSLTVTSGKYGRVFGGNNEGGSINGSITVNAYEDGCKPLIIGELYGGGFKAPYSIYGCTENSGTWTANTEGTLNFDEKTAGRAAVEVNVYSCTSIGKVFGGGYQAPVIGNTHVWINTMQGIVDGKKQTYETTPENVYIGKIGQVFGGGNAATVTGNTTIDIGTATVNDYNKETEAEKIGINIKSGTDYLNAESDTPEAIDAGVYGGGYSADVDGNTTLNIGTVSQNQGINIAGNIFGGGFGETTHVTGNVTVNIGKDNDGTPVGFANITGDVYGGSAKGTVNSTDNSTVNTYIPDPADSGTTANCYTKVNFYGGTITGNIHGGGLGEDNEETESDHAADVYGPVTVTMEGGSINNIFGCNNVLGTPKNTVTVNINGGTVNQSVYGGGKDAAYTPTESTSNYPAVNINNGTITGNVFGGGYGLSATVTGNPQVTIDGNDVAIKKSVYGGGEEAQVAGNTVVTLRSGTIGTAGEGGATYGNIYGGGLGRTDNAVAGLVQKNTNINIVGGTVLHNIYGGGAYGTVGSYTYNESTHETTCAENTGTANITVTGGTIGTDGHENGMVFGSSRGDVAAPDGIHDRLAWVNNTNVIIGTSGEGHGTAAPEPQIKGSVYGGGENGHTYKNASVAIHSGTIGTTEAMPSDPADQKGAKYPYRGNVYGGGCGTDKYYSGTVPDGHTANDGKGDTYNPLSGIVQGTTTVVIDGGHIVHNVYGAGAMGSVDGSTNVTITGGTIGANGGDGGFVYAAARGDAALTDAKQAYVGSTVLTISGGTIWDSAFGGGQSGIVKGNVSVTVSGGTVKNDVYGGGALANTNTDNWDTSANSGAGGWKVASSSEQDYYVPVKHLTVGSSSVTGYYTSNTGGGFISDAEAKADANTTYYKKLTYAENIHNLVVNGTTYKTTVNLTGGVIGNAYGGGLGRLTAGGLPTGEGAVKAMVYGDVAVNVNGTAFTALVESSAKNAPVTGRVFGCNNINGTPKGKVTVTVNKTRRIDGGNHTLGEFEIQGVYGGGNLSDYEPETYDTDTEFGQNSNVIINDCEVSISKVYGGGNAAKVPFTNVTINGAFEIGYVFGGGNGGDMIYKSGNWIDNTGADVTHYTNVLLRGGTIGQAFGGSDSKGTVGGSEIKQEAGGLCPLRIVNLYGAGNGEEASSAGDINITVSGCGENNEIQNVYGGSYKANITGSVTLNIKSGIFTSVFGGNDRMGSIGGNITVNIEETDECDKPIIIQNLYGGCYQTAYPGANARTWDKVGDKDKDASYTPFTRGKITVNVKSATRIDRIFGGSERGDVTGDTEININMLRGSMSGKSGVTLPSHYAVAGASVPENITVTNTSAYAPVYVFFPTSEDIAAGKERSSVDGYYTKDSFVAATGTAASGVTYYEENDGDYTEVASIEVGTTDVSGYYTKLVGEQYMSVSGKAKKGYNYYKPVVQGSITAGIGTIGDVFGGGNIGKVDGNTTVNIGSATKVIMETLEGKPAKDVLGAHFTGSVYGGGKEGDVTGNTYVNICAKETATPGTYEAVAEGAEKVTIAGNVYGGGKGATDSFTCEKAMVGINDDGATVEGEGESATYTLKEGGTTVTIGHGTVEKNVYGGGEVGRVERNTKVTIGFGDGTSGATKSPVIEGYVYGAGQGVSTHGYSGLVRGNSTVTIAGDSWVKHSVYGAGKLASLGRYWIATSQAEATQHNVEIGMPWGLKSGGQSSVTIGGYAVIGPETAMTMPTFDGNVFGGGKGILPYEDVGAEGAGRWYMNGSVYTWESYADASKEEAYIKYVETLGVTNNTVVTIGGNAFVKGSVYGGSENGYLFAGTSVTINGGQIGCGKNTTEPHPEAVWAADYTPSTDLECPSWEYTSPHAPYDKFANESGYDSKGGATIGSDGHTFYGNVFGGGSGKDPYKPGKWHKRAGSVGGNTVVNITGGHILTSVYGGNEMTDVEGKCTITMSGGTLGVPRTLEQIAAHPVTCYLFGAGKGDQRVLFNTWTNVSSASVSVTGGTVYGSVFGGGEDGHILGDAAVTIGKESDHTGPTIGTLGTSYVDGNVFGGGRGFSGEALTAGSTGGNVTMNIYGGTMLGSVYGGGRLASVGIVFTTPEDVSYGQLNDDTTSPAKQYGHITINISGGTIGTTTEAGSDHPVGGNVFGGSMGRITLLDGKLNPLWPKIAVVKLTDVTISGGEIMNNVYGGSEYGIVRNRATINMTGGTVHGNVFGGGYGSDDERKTTLAVGGYANTYYTFTPTAWTGCVSGSTFVNISGGTVAKNVYGGGDMASVGLIDFVSDAEGKYTNIIKHDTSNGFGLSWPYKFQYHAAAPNDLAAVGGGEVGGKATVKITGTAAITGYVFGAGKGKVWFGSAETTQNINEQRYTEASMSNIRETEVTIGTEGGSDNPTIGESVYGGGEDGHVYEDAKVVIHRGTIAHSVFGGGKGEGTFKTTLLDKDTETPKAEAEAVRSWTAGKVYGNTSVTMNGGSVGWYIYGGGNMGSVGKGNYAGGADDYSTAGYGETLTGNLWTSATVGDGYTAAQRDNAWHFLNSGKTTVTIMGGTVGSATAGAALTLIPYGSVFGGSRGQAALDVGAKSPRYRYAPDFFLGYVNKAVVNIGGYLKEDGTTIMASTDPVIYGSVYGGGQDGHVRDSTKVRIFKGTVAGQTSDSEGRSGHVFGAGSGIGTYTEGGVEKLNSGSGSVTCSALVEVIGGTINGNVYGGGALASVGPPRTGQTANEQKAASDSHKSCSYTQVNIKGGSVGGSVFGASRGPSDDFVNSAFTEKGVTYDPDKFATDIWSDVSVTGGTVGGSVYGGGEGGRVKESTTVSLTGGTITHNAYGGGKGTATIAANVSGNTTVELNKGVADDAKGCIVEKVFGCNDQNGTPKGHVKVHVYATQHAGKETISDKIGPKYDPSIAQAKDEGYIVYMNRLIEMAKSGGSVLAGIDASKITAAETTISGKSEASLTEDQKTAISNAARDVIAELEKTHDYDVKAVYGGGDLAAYQPTINEDKTEVIIEGCNVTSIKQVYGGGNAASVPATDVLVKSCFIIDEVFGGGNGLDNYQKEGKWYENPGAHVGYTQFASYDTGGAHGTGVDEENKYIAIVPAEADGNTDAAKAYRQEHYRYGTGVATTTINGGHIHAVYGGSNKKGNISGEARSEYQQIGTCTMIYDYAYGPGKDADTDAEITINLDCVDNATNPGTIYGGSYNANINSDVNIHITNGTYDKIFGGNNRAGTINGKITITIEEYGCTPIRINELYAGGNLAPYSVYGFKTETQNAKDANGNDLHVDDDPAKAIVQQRIPYRAGDAGALTTPRRDPQINIISASYIGKIFGGGYGAGATMIGNPHVNVNMTEGKIRSKYNDYKPEYATDYPTYDGDGVDKNRVIPIGTIGDIYGGGNLASVEGDTYVEIGTGKHHNETGVEEVITPFRNAARITGNVFGGGKGEAKESGTDAFFCKAAMVGVDESGEGSTSVTIANGSVGGSVYGGGEIGRVENNTEVTIGVEGEVGADTKFKPVVTGNVFGAGQGNDTHGYSGLVRGNSTVTIQGAAKIGHSVYGGGEQSTVGRYNVVDGKPTTPKSGGVCTVTVKDDAEIGPNDMLMTRDGGPDDSGYIFGAGKGVLPGVYTFEGDDKPHQMNGSSVWQTIDTEEAYLSFIETLGLASETHVTVSGNAFIKGSVYGGSENGYVQTNTNVTIEGGQIGNGYVQMDADGNYLAEGNRYSLNRRYTPEEWTAGHLDGVVGYENSLPECASWEYRYPYAHYDKFAGTGGYDSKGGATTGANGSTFYGNVFGGGSGYYPYAVGKWHKSAGSVGGNTTVTITGGHILTDVYGGNEMTNVKGNATINFGGNATLGVPRTLGQIMKHPVTCYLFGAGKGDPRVMFNKETNVKDVTVNITGGRIYGSVFGGGEDGHVLGNVVMNISDNTEETNHVSTKIGTWGTSYVDGNVFGAGRGFGGEAYTAGNVAGNVTMKISGGTMLGSVYGGGRLGSVGYDLLNEGAEGYGQMRNDEEGFPRGHVTIDITGGTIGNTNEFIMPDATNIAALNTALGKSLNTDFTTWTDDGGQWTTWKSYYNVPNTEYDPATGMLTHTKGGNVYAGGMGRYMQLDGINPITGVDWKKLGNVKSTTLNISGDNTWIMGNVYGGGEMGAVTPYMSTLDATTTTTITVTGGTIGTEVTGSTPTKETVAVPESGSSAVKYTFGSIYGGGMGMATPDATNNHGGDLYGSSTVSVSGEKTKVRGSVFGGGEMAIVGGDTHVTISGGEIGRNEVKPKTDSDPGYVMFGGATMGNVYGGGKGLLGHTNAGQVKGNTYVTISAGTKEGQPFIYHNVYGGGALASVGTFEISKGGIGLSPAGVPYWPTGPDAVDDGKGVATVTITGGTIGISGRDNGMVFGSSRGNIAAPEPVYFTQAEIAAATEGSPAYGKTTSDIKNYMDPYNKVAWVKRTNVTIGTEGGNRTTPLVRGSVYGGGENGHNYQNATVNVLSGTIGIPDKKPANGEAEEWWDFSDAGRTAEQNTALNAEYRAYRGNVYGAGSGTDTYKGAGGKEYHNPRAGMVGGSTVVNIKGGHIGRSIYGAGAMASLGNIINARDTLDVSRGGTGNAKHLSETNGFALSWPYLFNFVPQTGKATVNVTGGHIGTLNVDGGDVYGSARGEAGDRYEMAHFAYANTTEVTIDYPETAEMNSAIESDYDIPCITGSVHGSGENGYVYGDTHVTLKKGLISHSLYGAGKGKSTYTKPLNKIGGGGTYDAKIYSLIAGRVMGDTYVTMTDGHVGRNVYGGGNMGSVGKGNYAGGTDDYNQTGYGEAINGKLWTSTTEGDNAWHFLNSGKTHVTVTGGIVGYIDETDPTRTMKNGLPYGNVFGGSAGEAAPNVPASLAPRYEYCPAFFSGCVNETDVTIGTLGQNNDDAGQTGKAPRILGSVYGGGQDGHVRRLTHVTVNSGVIGMPFTEANKTLLQQSGINDPQWLYRGCVYGGGSGISEFKHDFNGDGDYDDTYTIDGVEYKEMGFSNSSGSVTHFTTVDVLGGLIYRAVLGGGSLGSVGAPKINQTDYAERKKDTAANWGVQSLNQVNVGGGKVGDTVVKATIGEPTGVAAGYGGNVFGGGRGEAGLGSDFGTSIWTQVNVKNGANILGNVYGGGNAGPVLKDTEVKIGE